MPLTSKALYSRHFRICHSKWKEKYKSCSYTGRVNWKTCKTPFYSLSFMQVLVKI